MASDAHLVGLIRQGRSAAFEAAYDRHHRAILSFCRHMLGSHEEAEDAVQQTFLSAYNDLIGSDKPIHLRAWLFTIARNRCYSILRARREQPVGELDDTATEGLATQVQRRQDLRDLVLDLQRLPEDQRAALVLAEMDALSHDQIATVLSVPREKVKALVFQARESLVASRAARETDCAEIREQIATLRGGALRRANLRRHLRECTGCREFRQQIDRQRHQLRMVLPVAPTLALKETVLAATVGGGAGVGAVTAGSGGGAVASSLLKGGVFKGLIGAAIAGVGTAGTLVAVHDIQLGVATHGAGGHALVLKAPFRPAARSAGSTAGGASSSTRSTTSTSSRYVASSSSSSSSAAAAGKRSYSASGAAPSVGAVARRDSHSKPQLASATPLAVLKPLSGGLGRGMKLPGSLAPTHVASAPAAAAPGPAAPGGAGTGGGQAGGRSSHLSSVNAPFLGASAFGTGAQAAVGGTRAAGSGASTPSASAPTAPASSGSAGTGTSSSSTASGSPRTYRAPTSSSSSSQSAATSSGGRSSRTVSTPSSTPSPSQSAGSSSPAGSSTPSTGSSPASPPATTTAPTVTTTPAPTTPAPTTTPSTPSSSGSTGSSGSSSGGYGGGTDTGPHGR